MSRGLKEEMADAMTGLAKGYNAVPDE